MTENFSARPLQLSSEHLLIGEPLQMVIAAAFEIVFTSGDDAVHFYPSKLRAFGAEDFSLVSYIFGIQSLLANAVLRECCYLAEAAGGPCCQRILESPELTEWCKENRCDRESALELQIGDYVVAHLCLCKVVDMHRSPYGLVSYNVKLIDRAFPQKNIPMEGDNWIRANHVRLFLKATDPRAKDLALVMDLWSEEIEEIV